MSNDWESHKLLIMQELKDLKTGQKEIREDINKINEKVTELKTKAVSAGVIISFIVSSGVAIALALLK